MNVGDGNDSPWDDAPSAGTKAETSVRDPLPSASAAPKKTPGGRAGRGGRRQATQPVRLEAVDDSLGPLGPLGVESQSSEAQEEDPPALPRKERQIQRNEASVSSPPPSRGRRQPASPNDEPDEPYPRARVAAQPVQPASPDGPQRQPHPSMSIEQASKPSFNISVGDPHKVGDLTGSHTVYQVRTRVCAFLSHGLAGRHQTDVILNRRHQKPTASQNSKSRVDTRTSCGYTISSTATTLE